jgi:hypothetical protein
LYLKTGWGKYTNSGYPLLLSSGKYGAAYAHFLAKRDRPAITVLTKMYFDEGSDTPKLFFKPTRPLRDEEISVVSDMINDPDTIRAITLEYTPSEGNAISPFEVTDGFKTNN